MGYPPERPHDRSLVPADDTAAPGVTVTREGQVINYYFPVEVEIVGSLDAEQLDTVTEHVFRVMADELGSRA